MFPDIEECATHSDNCHADANCTNTKGSFYCKCLYGYYGDGVTCNGMFILHVISMCNQVVKSNIINTASEINRPVPNFTSIPFWLPINLMGDKLHSRSRDNYFLNTYPVQKRSQNLLNQTCAYFLDVNECISSDDDHHLAHNCHADANCTNTKGSFYCNCHTGYSGDGVTCSGNYGFLVVYVILFIFHVLWCTYFIVKRCELEVSLIIYFPPFIILNYLYLLITFSLLPLVYIVVNQPRNINHQTFAALI